MRKIDVLFNLYQKNHQSIVNNRVNRICIPLIYFSLISLLSSIPFPYLSFLGKYNTYINWFSLFLAISIYYYYKLSPVISYMVLLCTGILYVLVIQLEHLEKAGGPKMWLVGIVLLIIGLLCQLIGYRYEGKFPSFIDTLKLLIIGPAWLAGRILKVLNINY